MAERAGIDLTAPAAIADPHSLFHRLRDSSPVHRSDVHNAWLVLSHAGVAAAFRDDRLSADRMPAFERMAASRSAAFGRVVELLRGWMVFREGTDHKRLRDPVRTAFTPRRVEGLTASIERTASELLDRVGEEGASDLRTSFAAPLPALVIADLLGIPRRDRAAFQAWSDLLGAVVFAAESRSASDDAAVTGADHFWSYFTELCDHRRRHPGDDLVSDLVAAVGPGSLEPGELVGACTLLLFAGHETTAGLITNGARVLLDHPHAAATLRTDPSLWPTAIDELLRLEGPAKLMVRRAQESVIVEGTAIGEGETVWLVILAADRDPPVFTDPDRLDLARNPNPHLAFGWGAHHCLGAALARLEGRIALRALLDRFPTIHATGPAVWGGGVMGRAIGRLDVRVS